MARPDRPADAGSASDPGIPTLQTVFGPTMVQHLRRVLPDRCASVTVLRIRILKRHQTRCTFEIEMPGAIGPCAVIGKVYAVDRADVYQAMDAIRQAGFGSDEAFSVPEPLAYVPRLRLLLLEKVAGPSVKEVLLACAEPDRVAGSERCARWLARFQAVVPPRGQLYRVEDVLGSLDDSSPSFGAAGDVLADTAKRLREQLEAAAGRLEPTVPCAGHGHYTCGQVLMGERDTVIDAAATRVRTGPEVPTRDRTVALDWDGYDVADPCRDVASFMVNLKRLAWKNPASRAALEQAATVFLKTYRARYGGRPVGNVPFYAAALCLRLARRDLEKHSRERSAALLGEGLHILEQGI